MKAKSRLRTQSSSSLLPARQADSSRLSRSATGHRWFRTPGRLDSLTLVLHNWLVPSYRISKLYALRGITFFLQTYRQQFKYLVPSMTFAAVVAYILLRVSPTVIVETPIYGLYLWLLLPFFLFLYYFSLFWFFRWYRALSLSLVCTVLLFLRLQQVEMSIVVPLALFLLPLALELIYRIIQSASSNKRYFRNRKRS